jgi:hypothetical protein
MARAALTLLLSCVGGLLAFASRKRANFRAALSRERTIALETGDGVAFHFAARERRFVWGRGASAQCDFRLRCHDSRQMLGVLLAPDGLGRILTGMAREQIQMTGDLLLFVWFQGRIAEAWPIRKTPRKRFPGAYIRAHDDIAAAASIRREAPAEALDPDWAAASKAREELLIWRVACGAGAPKF